MFGGVGGTYLPPGEDDETASVQSSTGTAVGGVSPVLNAGTGVGVGVVGVGGGAGVPVVAYGASSSHASTLSEDFVLLSEFSEQEGPIPLMTIPKSAIDDQSQIDFSGFVVRTMAVDHQARVGEGFTIPEDSSVFLTEPMDKIYAYVHYVTLFDVFARGFVRPICVSYITYDKEKIMTNFEDLRAEFSKSVLHIKEDNFNLFLIEVEQRYHDLVYTKSVLSSAEATSLLQPNAEDGQQAIDKDNIDGFIREAQAMIKVVSKKLANIRNILYKRRSVQYSVSSQLNSPTPSTPRSRSHTLEETSSSAHNNSGGSTTLNKVVTIEEEDDASNDSFSKLIQQPQYQPRFLRFFHKASRFDQALRTLEKLTGAGYHVCVQKWARILSHFKRPSLVLELEKDDAGSILPSPLLLTIGRCPLINMADGRFVNVGQLPPSQIYEPFFMSRRITVNKSAVKDTTTVSSSAEARSGESIKKADDESSLSCSYESAKDSLLSSSPPYEDALELMEEYDGLQTSFASDGGDMDLQDNTPPVYSTLTGFSRSAQSRSHTISSVIDSNLLQQERQRIRMKPMAVASFADHLDHVSPNKPGAGIFKLRRNYNLKHILFALLKGRPVLVYGQPEDELEIRALIATLSLFVPGHSSRYQVHPWRTKPLTMLDLSRVKLAGLSRRISLPKNVEAYVSIWDYETETFKTPVYGGSIVDNLVGRQKTFSDEMSFMAHIHTVMLELAVKTYIYYHVCIASAIDIPSLRLSGGTLVLTPQEEMATYPAAIQNILKDKDPRSKPTNTDRALSAHPPSSAVSSSSSSSSNKVAPSMSADESPRVETRSTTTTSNSDASKLRQFAQTRAANAAQPRMSFSGSNDGHGYYPAPLIEKTRRLFAKLEVHAHDREIIEYLGDVIRSQQLADVDLTDGGAPQIHLDQRRCQMFSSNSKSGTPLQRNATTTR